jgi:hypothetical protein
MNFTAVLLVNALEIHEKRFTVVPHRVRQGHNNRYFYFDQSQTIDTLEEYNYYLGNW